MRPYSPGDDIFASSADAQFNNFSNQYNPVAANMAAGVGGWGINPAYMTPAYLSPLRPRYTGPQGPNQWGPSPGWFESTWRLAGPHANANYGGNSYAQYQPYISSAGQRFGAQAMSLAQDWALPAAAMYYSFKHLEGPAAKWGRTFGANLARGMFGTTGSGALTAAKFMGGAGALAGSWLGLPALAMAGVEGANALAFQGAHAHIGSTNDFRRNFANVAFGEGGGNVVTGRGLSWSSASYLGRSASYQGLQDPTFTADETRGMADYASRSGLFDTSSAGGIPQKLKSVMSQTKMLMALMNSSDFKETMEQLSKFMVSGATGASANRLMGILGHSSTMSGMSFQKLVNTIGVQGGMLYGAAGLTPSVGIQNAALAAGHFGAAYRTGLISEAMMAQMGGREGAAQSANVGLLSLGQSPYMSMLAYNSYLGRGNTGNIVGNVSAFGGSMVGNPLEQIGRFNMMAPGLTSKMLGHDGLGPAYEMLGQMGDIIPGAKTGTGKIGWGAAYQMLNSITKNPEASRALLNQLFSAQDRGTRDQSSLAASITMKDQWMKFMEQNQMTRKDVLDRQFGTLWRHAKTTVSDMMESQMSMIPSALDFMEEKFFGLNYRDLNSLTLNPEQEIKRYNNPWPWQKNYRWSFNTTTNQMVLDKIDTAASMGNKLAIEYKNTPISEKDKKRALLRQMHKDKVFTALIDPSDSKRLDDIVDHEATVGTRSEDDIQSNRVANILENYSTIERNHDVLFGLGELSTKHNLPLQGILIGEFAQKYSEAKNADERVAIEKQAAGFGISDLGGRADRAYKNRLAGGRTGSAIVDQLTKAGLSTSDLELMRTGGPGSEALLDKMFGAGSDARKYFDEINGRVKNRTVALEEASSYLATGVKGAQVTPDATGKTNATSTDALKDMQNFVLGQRKIAEQNDKYYRAGKIDFSGYYNNITALEESAATHLFSTAVTVFADAVENMIKSPINSKEKLKVEADMFSQRRSGGNK